MLLRGGSGGHFPHADRAPPYEQGELGAMPAVVEDHENAAAALVDEGCLGGALDVFAVVPVEGAHERVACDAVDQSHVSYSSP
jgi:hypothetical protein